MKHQKPNKLLYALIWGIAYLAAVLIFRRKFIRNELRDQAGPYVVIANHQAALDFVNLMGATKKPLNFVISQSFFSTLPFQGILKKLGLIPKQQFQTTVADLKKMKSVIDHGDRLVIYPAGLMCEDGLSTPIPKATYKFIKWMDTDVYVARTQGSYFVMPKWSKGFRPGRTYIDIYKLFSREELKNISLEELQQKADEVLLYDAYREQEQLQVCYKNGHNIRGLEYVLYRCPRCSGEHTLTAVGEDTLRCVCGFTAKSDVYGFLTTEDPALRYVSDWSRWIFGEEKKAMLAEGSPLIAGTQILMVDPGKGKYLPVGSGRLTLGQEAIRLEGVIRDEAVDLRLPAGNVPTLPFSPGKYLELQSGSTSYRCCLEDGKQVMKFINRIKILYELKKEEKAPV